MRGPRETAFVSEGRRPSVRGLAIGLSLASVLLGGCEAHWSVGPTTAAKVAPQPKVPDAPALVVAEQAELERALAEVSKELAADGLTSERHHELLDRRLRLTIALVLLDDLRDALASQPELAVRLLAPWQPLPETTLPVDTAPGDTRAPAPDPLDRWNAAVDVAIERTQRASGGLLAADLATVLAEMGDVSGSAMASGSADRERLDAAARAELERTFEEQLAKKMEAEGSPTPRWKPKSNEYAEGGGCLPSDPLCDESDLPAMPQPVPVESAFDSHDRASRRQPAKPSTSAPHESDEGTRGRAVVQDTSLSSSELGRLERVLRRAIACVPPGPSGGRVAVRATLAGGRLVRTEIRSELDLPLAVQSCILQAARRVRVDFGLDGIDRSVEVALVER